MAKSLISSYYSNYYSTHTIINKCILDGKIYMIYQNQIVYKYIKIDFKILCLPDN